MTRLPVATLSRTAVSLAATAVLGTLLVLPFAQADAATPFMRQMNIGARGNDVIRLQEFLATSGLIYPEGIVSGYYGPLTRNAVLQFQVSYGLPQAGRVRPMTLAKMNGLVQASPVLDVGAPAIGAVTLQTTRTGATVIWTTNENARGTVHYATAPLVLLEAQSMTDVPYVSGSTATNDGALRTMQSVTLSGLAANTTHYYSIRSVDAAGNITISWPAAFRTLE